ncbi:hypothetical protein ACIQY5_00390 [Peribacillus frigoritolerans]|uniref:hypothetical protein n=1 Tax=Peribacillus frigoritolerans TaxID=450367 RepID=UPI0038010239
MNMIVLPIFFMLFSLVLATPTFSSEKDDQELEELAQQKGEIIYMDDEITVRSFGNDTEISDVIFTHPNSVVVNENNPMLYSSATGPGGRASIVASDTGRSVYWSVKPATAWPYNFKGIVKLRYHSGFKRDAPVGGMGALGSTISGGVTMNKNNGGYATLTGTAYALNKSRFSVLPGVTTSFRPN